MRNDVLLSRTAHGGATERAHLEAAARKGSQTALADLEYPEPPQSMLYLVDWAYALCGRSGASMEGLAPLAYETIEAWSRLMDLDVTPLEVRALIALDAVIRKPEPDGLEERQEEVKVNTPWPERK